MEILVKNAAVVKVLDEIGEAYRALCPGDWERFIQAVKEEGQRLQKQNAMSSDGTMLNYMKIPCVTWRGRTGNLYAFIKHEMKKRCGIEDFFAERENYQLLCRVWKDAKVKNKPTSYLKVPAGIGKKKG